MIKYGIILAIILLAYFASKTVLRSIKNGGCPGCSDNCGCGGKCGGDCHGKDYSKKISLNIGKDRKK